MHATLPIRSALLLLAVCLTGQLDRLSLAQVEPLPKAQAKPSPQEAEAKPEQEQRRQFQSQELITAKPGTWIFNPSDPPRIVWRDGQEIQRLGGDSRFRVRWFDAKLKTCCSAQVPSDTAPSPAVFSWSILSSSL